MKAPMKGEDVRKGLTEVASGHASKKPVTVLRRLAAILRRLEDKTRGKPRFAPQSPTERLTGLWCVQRILL